MEFLTSTTFTPLGEDTRGVARKVSSVPLSNLHPLDSTAAEVTNMTESSEGANLANTIRGLKKFDGRNPAEFKTWMKKLCIVISVTRRDILPLLKETARPTHTSNIAEYDRANEDLYAMLFFLVELPASLCVQKHENDDEISGDGQAAFKELCNTYDKVTDEVIRATMEELMNTPMELGQNPDDYFNQKRLLRIRAEKMGEHVSDRYFKDICVTGFTDNYKDVKMMMYRDPSFDVDQMQTTMRHMFLDEQSRNRTKGRIAGRGSVMTAVTSEQDTICYWCKIRGHSKKDCLKFKSRTKPAGAAKWCSVHRTTTHRNEECYSQGATRPTKNASVSLACTNCRHCTSADSKEPTVDNTEPSHSDEPIINFAGSSDDFDGGFMYAAGMPGRFTPSAKGATLLVDSGASESFPDDELISDLKTRMREFKTLSTPREITTAGKHTLHGIGTGFISFTIRDNHGTQLPVNMRALVVPGLGRNIFAPTAELRNGVRFVLEKKSYLTIRGTAIPLKQDPRDQGMCSLDITFQRDSHGVLGKSEGVSPDSGSGVVYTATTSASVWHRRLGHMNPCNMEVLRNKKGNGVEYTGTISGCDICSVTKSKQQAHPKKSTRKTTRPMQLVYTDLMGPFTPAVKGGYRFVSKFTDDYSRMKEIFLLKNKTEAAESLHQYNMTVAAPLGLRIENLRCDKGGEYTGQEFRTLCVGAGINIEYTATNTPQQNGVSERDGQTLAKITRCLMKDGDFPPFMWGELMFNSKAYRIYNPAKGTVVERRNVTFLETPAYTLPPDVTTEDYHYEEDVLRFTSALDSSLLEEDLFTPNCDLSSAELEGQVQRLRQEVRRLSKINAAQSPSPSSTPASPGVAVDQRDARTREPEPASPSINQESENEDEHGPPLPAAPVTGPSLRIRSDGRPFEVTRASTRRSPSSKDTEYSGALHTLFPTYDHDPRALTSSQLLHIATQTTPSMLTTADSAHLDGQPFDTPRAFVYATGVPVHKRGLGGGSSCQNPQQLQGALQNDRHGRSDSHPWDGGQARLRPGTLAITQTDYVENLLERFEIQNANVAHTPGYGQELSSEQPEDKLLGAQGIKLYQSITGSLLYLAQCTRYDLCYAVNQLTRACNRPAEVHMTAAKHVLRYLRGTPDLPITYRKGQLRLVSYTDASFGANPDNRKSTTGYLFFLGGAPISFGSKTQSLTAQSTVESELQALSYGAREAVYLSNFLTELGLKDSSQVPIRSDSTGALSVAGNSMFSARTKHIALRYFFVRELVKKNKITLHCTPTKQMLADIATKHLSKHTFRDLLQQIKNFTS